MKSIFFLIPSFFMLKALALDKYTLEWSNKCSSNVESENKYINCSLYAQDLLKKQEIAKARVYFQKGCNQSHRWVDLMDVCSRLASLEEDLGNVEEAKRIWKLICNSKYFFAEKWGCTGLARLQHESGNSAEATKIYKNICYSKVKNEFDDYKYDSCRSLSLLEWEKGNKLETRKHLNYACNRGHNTSCIDLINITQGNNIYPFTLYRFNISSEKK